ncbi:MAG: hypothetical protein J5865_08185 [Lachnospiraceae bacterium]|nr:hypothetical protein [Lachnospiraceae bacterium]
MTRRIAQILLEKAFLKPPADSGSVEKRREREGEKEETKKRKREGGKRERKENAIKGGLLAPWKAG